MTLEGWDRVTWARRRRRAFHVQRRAKPQREGRILVKWLSEGVWSEQREGAAGDESREIRLWGCLFSISR